MFFGIVVALGLWAVAFPATAPAHGAEPRRNVLLVTLDTFRADRLAPETSPNLDRLAAAGARFARARAVAPLTLPSHASILTATWPRTHGLRDNGDGPLDAARPALAEVLAARGYDTAAFVGSFVLDRRFGLDRGFAHYDDRVTRDVALLESPAAERDGGEVVAAFEAWLDARANGDTDITAGPFFAWLHLYDPHAPYEAPEPFASRFQSHLPTGPYDAEIAYTDSLVGRALEALRAHGLLATTLVAAVGDHGEGLGEHGESTHALLVYSSTLHVPMVLWAPGLAPQREVGDLVRTIDLAPTILELLAVEERLGKGRSLAPLLAGEAMAPAPAFGESLYASRHLGWSPLHTVELGRYKYIAAPESELYDVVEDPAETENRIASQAVEAERLSAILAAEVELVPATAEVEPAEGDAADAETTARLRSLGYLAGSAPDPAPNVDPKHQIELWERLQLAATLQGRGDYAAAARAFEAVLRTERSIPLVYESLGACYVRLERWAEAERLYAQALERGIDSSAIRVDLGLAHTRRGDAQRAAVELHRALALDPSNVAAHHHLGDLHRAAARFAEAAAAYRAALAINPEYVYAWNGLGRALAAVGNAEAALAAFRRAVEIAPTEAHGVLNLAVQLERMGRAAEAGDTYRRCLELEASPEVRELAAQGLERLGGD
jgi:arylsulfatase A-like enzyme/Tfp pilus assembly protein PilF